MGGEASGGPCALAPGQGCVAQPLWGTCGVSGRTPAGGDKETEQFN